MKIENLDTITGRDVFLMLFYSKLDAVGAVFQTLGWFHTRPWARKEDAIENTIVELCDSALKDLKEGKEAIAGTGGLEINLWFEQSDKKELNGSLMIEL